MKWIKVKESIPDTNRDVLIYGPGYEIIIAWFDKEFKYEECGNDGGETKIADWVTHWMELPEKPEL